MQHLRRFRVLAVLLVVGVVFPAAAYAHRHHHHWWSCWWQPVEPVKNGTAFDDLSTRCPRLYELLKVDRRVEDRRWTRLDDTTVYAAVNGGQLSFNPFTVINSDVQITYVLESAELQTNCMCSRYKTTGTASIDREGDVSEVPVRAWGQICECHDTYCLRVRICGYGAFEVDTNTTEYKMVRVMVKGSTEVPDDNP